MPWLPLTLELLLLLLLKLLAGACDYNLLLLEILVTPKTVKEMLHVILCAYNMLYAIRRAFDHLHSPNASHDSRIHTLKTNSSRVNQTLDLRPTKIVLR